MTDEEQKAMDKAMAEQDHYETSPGMVYCPIEGRKRPWFMCAREHGDRDPQIDMEPKGAD